MSLTEKAKSNTRTRPSQRGLGPEGGAWSIQQAAAWCGIGEHNLRRMVQARQVPCAFFIGRRILLPREGFKAWFNGGGVAPRNAPRKPVGRSVTRPS